MKSIIHQLANNAIPQSQNARLCRLVRQAASSLHRSGLLLREAASEAADPLHAQRLLKLSGAAKKASDPLRRISRKLEARVA